MKGCAQLWMASVEVSLQDRSTSLHPVSVELLRTWADLGAGHNSYRTDFLLHLNHQPDPQWRPRQAKLSYVPFPYLPFSVTPLTVCIKAFRMRSCAFTNGKRHILGVLGGISLWAFRPSATFIIHFIWVRPFSVGKFRCKLLDGPLSYPVNGQTSRHSGFTHIPNKIKIKCYGF